MKVLLVNPWIYDFAAFDLWAKPLGLLYITSALRKLDCEVHLIDCLDRNYPKIDTLSLPKCGKYYREEVEKPDVIKHIPRKYKRYGIPIPLFEKSLEDKNPDIILVSSGMTYWYPGVFKAIEILKEKFPDVPMLLGGIYATICTEHAKKYSGVDVLPGGNIGKIVEKSFSLAEKELNQEIPELKNLCPAYDLYNKLDYVAIRTSWGCPFRCSYCAIRILSSSFKQRESAQVVDEIEFLHGKFTINNFAFYDDALLFNTESHLSKILEGILKVNLKCNFYTPNGIHARYLTQDIAHLMHQANFVMPRLSLETSNKKRQEATGGKVTNREFEESVKFLQKAGYKAGEIGAYVMMGMPGQDFKEVEKSIKFASDLGTRVFLVEYSPIPGTRDWHEYKFDFSDPLLHNNSIFPLYSLKEWDRFQKLKDLSHQYNSIL